MRLLILQILALFLRSLSGHFSASLSLLEAGGRVGKKGEGGRDWW